MTIQLSPETQRLVQEELERCHFHSVDELIVEGIQAWREKHNSQQLSTEQRRLAIARMKEFAEKNRTSLGGISIKELIHEGHRV